MNTPDNKLPPLKNITESGTYVLKMIRPKDDKINERFKKNSKGFASCRLFFLDGDGNCLTKNFTAEFPKGLAMTVGKFTGTYSPAPPTDITVENLIRYVDPAFGKKATVELEVTRDPQDWQGKPQYRYKFNKITGMDAKVYGSPAAPEAPAADDFTQEAPPF